MNKIELEVDVRVTGTPDAPMWARGRKGIVIRFCRYCNDPIVKWYPRPNLLTPIEFREISYNYLSFGWPEN